MKFKDIKDAKVRYRLGIQRKEKIIFGWTIDCDGSIETKSVQGLKGSDHQEASENLKTQPEHLIKTLERFKEEIQKNIQK
jgi:hypothetical protein